MRYETGWFKSSHSAPASDNCVESRITPANVALRDSVHPQGTVLAFDAPAWQAFLHAVCDEEL